MDVPTPSLKEDFEEIDTTNSGPSLEPKENGSLLDRGKSVKKQSKASPSISTPTKLNMTGDQVKYCGAIMRNLKKHRDAAPFLNPVDYVKLNIPDYPQVIKYPMDLSTVDKKLNAGAYDAVEEFINDIKLVFNNCYKFNGPEAMVSMLCQNVESAFEKSLRQMPPSRPLTPPRRSVSPFDDDYETKRKKSRSNSTAKSPGRRISEDVRPRKENHSLPSKDYAESSSKRRNPRKNDAQMKFCMQALREMKKNKYRDINYPFLQPVDVVALNIPDYVDIIKRPMDISTIERKLNEGAYDEPEDFERDVRLMFNNCYTYNPATLPVHKMGRELERVFDEKWAQKPEIAPIVETSLREVPEEGTDSDSASDSDDERDQKIAELERHIATISQQIATIKSQKRKKAEKAAAPKENRTIKEKRKRVTKKPTQAKKAPPKQAAQREEYPEFTFDQKKDLSDLINNLQGDRLNTVVSIIQSSMPNLNGQGQDEIVLDIDSLDRRTLHRLHEFVTGDSLVRNKKRARTQYSQDRKLQELKKTLQKFNSDNDTSSDSESDSSSGSDSDDSGSSSD